MKANCDRWIAKGITLLFILIFSFQIASAESEQKSEASANCDIQAGACVQPLGDGAVTLEILPRPVTAMRDLTFRVVLEDLSPDGVPGIDLWMPGMTMGPNHVTLEKTSESVYTGTGVIVRCPSGRTLWQADIAVPGVGNAVFIFNVVY